MGPLHDSRKVVCWNNKDPKNDPRHLRLIGDSLWLGGIRPPIGVRHAHNNSNDDKY